MKILTVFIFLTGINITAQNFSNEEQWLIKKTLNDLVFVEGGTFKMGDVGYTDNTGVHRNFSGDGNSFPIHEVTLDNYSMGKLEVTYREFDLFCLINHEELIGKRFRREGVKIIQPEFSANKLTWDQARAYCYWLKDLTGLNFDLATDAQWEYAARSRGKAVKFATDNGKLDRGRNYKGPEYSMGYNPPPGSFTPNPLGIYDMSGGVAEWVLDGWYGYSYKSQFNPLNNIEITLKIVRGFSGSSLDRRGYRDASNTGAGIGIRFVVNQKEPVDVDAVLKRLGIPPITEEEKEAFMPKNWP